MVEPRRSLGQYITKQLEYGTKNHIETHTILFNLKRLYSFVSLSGITVLNKIILLIAQSRLSVTQASSSFKRLVTRTPTYATPTFIIKTIRLATSVLNDCKSEFMAYGLVSTTHFNCKATPTRYRLYLPNKSYITCSANHMGSIHLLIINSLGAEHTRAHARKQIQMSAQNQSIFKKTGARRPDHLV